MMRNTACWIAAAFAFATVCAVAQTPAPSAPPPPSTSPPVEYKPPVRGAPKVRVGGSTRSAVRELSLAVVAPDHTGLASSDQPELFWYISQPVKTPLEFTIIASDAIDPLVEKPLPPVTSAGIQRIRLADFGVKLKPGEEYQWSISFVADAAARSKDTVASGRVRVAPIAPELASRVQGAGGRSYAEYANAGYWYDALATLRRQMGERPRDATLLAAQQSLLEQVGLVEIARHERERASGN
jgi:hypothetical protein